MAIDRQIAEHRNLAPHEAQDAESGCRPCLKSLRIFEAFQIFRSDEKQEYAVVLL